jgi:hypothetical protein
MAWASTFDKRTTTLTQSDQDQHPGPNPSQRLGTSPEPLSGIGIVTQASRRVLFLDDDPVRAAEFLLENPEAVWVQTVTECRCRLSEFWDEVHLDHDLGGKQFVDPRDVDCGMEVIRWLCEEPRLHLLKAHFFIHTHNTFAGLFMVLSLRDRGYNAEFRPFGVDIAMLLARNEPDENAGADADCVHARSPTWERWLGWLRYFRRSR